jgi:CubicO group peptidase (beta-lactamase class C family)
MFEAQSPSFSTLGDWIRRKMAADGTPGLTISVTDRDHTLWSAGYGFSDIAAKRPMTPDTLLEIGSIGKSFTAFVFMQMAERGEIDLHAPVSSYLPWFAVSSEFAPITIHHLLSHTAGIVMGTDFAYDGAYETWALREMPRSGSPGESFRYSNVGYKTLGYLLEVVTGRPYGELVTEAMLQPLGMMESVCPIQNDDRLRMAVGYRRLYIDRPTSVRHPLVPEPWIETFTADGSVASTATDMAKYARLLLNRGSGIISDDGFEKMVTPAVMFDRNGVGTGYGYGLGSWEQDGRPIFGHSGGMVGYFAQLIIDPKAELAAAMMINGPGDTLPYALAAISAARCALGQTASFEPPAVRDWSTVENAAAIAGLYSGANGSFSLTEDGLGLRFIFAGQSTSVESKAAGKLLVDVPEFASFLLQPESGENGIIGFYHGPHWYGRDGAPEPGDCPLPEEWRAYPGLYRNHNPWSGAVTVFLRNGKLFAGVPRYGHFDELTPMDDGSFLIGEVPSPSRVRFDAIASGKAMKLTYDGDTFFRSPSHRS